MNIDSLFLPLGNKQGEVPKRIQLLPAGPVIKGRDGREWIIPNADEVVRESNSLLPHHPIDENHAIDYKAPKGEGSPAFGWFSNIVKEPDGSIWADVAWTEKGEKAVSSLEYRYLSPAFKNTPDGTITKILRAALTNNPNLDITSLNNIEQPQEEAKEKIMKNVLAVLGLPETATENEAIAKVAALQTQLNATQNQKVDLTAYAPRTDLAEMEKRAVKAETELTSLNAASLKKEAEEVIDNAIKEGKIAPANKEEYLSFCASKEGLEKIKKVMSNSSAIVAEGEKAPAGTPVNAGVSLNAAEQELMAAAGYTAEEWKKIKEKSK